MIYKFTITFKKPDYCDYPVTNIMYVIDKNKKKLFNALTEHIGEETDIPYSIVTWQAGVGYTKYIDDTVSSEESDSFTEYLMKVAGEHLADYVVYGETAIYSKNVETVKVVAQ